MRRLAAALEKLPKPVHVVLGAATLAVVVAVDILTAADVSVTFFYVVPVIQMAWFVGRAAAVVMAVAGSAGFLWAFLAQSTPLSHPWVPYWNAGAELGGYVVVGLILATLREQHDLHARMAATDSLTGVPNRRAFLERLHVERERIGRTQTPLTLAFVDLDRFKAVNDALGHLGGDRILRRVVEVVLGTVRATDVVGRLGGDEFGLLLPDTPAEAAAGVLEKVRRAVAEGLREAELPVTCSVGAVSVVAPAPPVPDLLRMADAEMYAAKEAGRNVVRLRRFP